jgi:hypothetical protein
MAFIQAIRLSRSASDVKAATAAALAMGKGVVHAPNYATTDKSGWCERPIVIDQEGEGHWRLGSDGKSVREPARTLSQQVRCRKCDGCLKERRCMWANRAVSEFREAAHRGGRTWFVTLTFKPEQHYRLTTKTRLRCAEQGVDLDALPWSERYAEMLREYHAEVDLFLARLRGGLAKRGWKKVRFRYLMVPEPHKSGFIHYHLLLHEQSADMPIVKRRIEAAWLEWGLGFVKAKEVVSEKAASYTTKYLGKNHFEGRIRNSQHYGKVRGEHPHPEIAEDTMRQWLWEDQRYPADAPRGEVIDLREEIPFQEPAAAKSTDEYGKVADGSEEARMREPALPDATSYAKRSDDPISSISQIGNRALREALALAPDEESDGIVRVGEYLGVCPSGLHIGKVCDCQAQPADLECEDVEHDELRGGVPKRKWVLRGWHETTPGRGAPGVPRLYKRRSEAEPETQH